MTTDRPGNKPGASGPGLDQTSKVLELLSPELAAGGFDLLDVRLFQGGGRTQVRVYVDTAEGINLDGVAKATRTISMLLEEADIFPGRYVIEVSSPGIRRPLRTLEHFESAVGHRVDVQKHDQDGKRRVKGVLKEIVDSSLIIERPPVEEEAPELVTIALDTVIEGNLDPEFDAKAIINADRRRRKEDKQAKRANRGKKRCRPKSK